MQDIEVVEVETSAQLREFIDFPNRLYADDPNYVVPLWVERKEFFDKKKNPFYKTSRTTLFLAMSGREVVGRIATCINYAHNNYHEEKVGFFGFLDTRENYEIAKKLLKVAMITLKKEGMEKMRGPANFSTNHEVGFLVQGFDSPPTVMMTYNQPYIVEYAERFGLKKVMDLLAFEIREGFGIPERIQRVVQKRQEKSNVTIRTLNMKDFDNELQKVREIYNAAWSPNWGFVPMDEAEFEHAAAGMKQILDPRIVLFAEHEGEVAGFSLALPDINQALIHLKGRLFPFGLAKLLWHTKVRNKIDRVRMVIFGIKPEYQKRAIDSMLFIETYNRGIAAGYTHAELSWTLESNELMIRASEQMGAERTKRYRIMEMPL